jgi:hypothetical protein
VPLAYASVPRRINGLFERLAARRRLWVEACRGAALGGSPRVRHERPLSSGAADGAITNVAAQVIGKTPRSDPLQVSAVARRCGAATQIPVALPEAPY